MHRLKLYLSSATRKLGPEELGSLLETSQARNREVGVTGVLLHHDGNFLQVLEGDRRAIDGIWQRILRDRRHRGILPMLDEEREERLFPEWSMAFRQAGKGERLPGWSDFLEHAGRAPRERAGVALTLLESFRDGLRG